MENLLDIKSISSISDENNLNISINNNINKEFKKSENGFKKNYNCYIKKINMNKNTFKEQYYNSKLNNSYVNPEYFTNPEKFKNKDIFMKNQKIDDKLNLDKRINFKKNNNKNKEYTGPWSSDDEDNKNVKEIEINKNKVDIEELYRLKKEKEDLNNNKNIEAKADFDPDYQSDGSNEIDEDINYNVEFFIKNKYDYKGISYLFKNLYLYKNKNSEKVNLPNKMKFQYQHQNIVKIAKFFPKYGQYVLSGSNDSTIKLWDVYGNFKNKKENKLILHMEGHSKGIKDLNFNNNGNYFLSSSYDNRVNYWDLEKGTIIRTFNTKKYPNCIKFNPEEDKQHLFLLGSDDSKIFQYDLRNGEKILEYTNHASSVNSISFCDSNKKFISSSDDKKVYLWEFGYNQVIKQIHEPDIHIYNTINYNNNYIWAQTYNNKIVVLDVSNSGLRLYKNKIFSGHLTNSYSIGISVSYDGNYIASGDYDGNIKIWDWKNCKIQKTIKSHNGVCYDVEFSPNDRNKLLSCGNDNLVKIWDN